MALTTTQKTEAYQFFIVAFGAATGVEYMNQLNDAYNAGMTTKQIVNVYTTKPQFETLYPRFDTNEQFAERLIENVVGASATAAAKTEAKADVAAALNAGWTKGDIVFQIFTNLAAKASTDAQWGKTSLMLANKVAVAQYITETQLVNTTDLTKLSSYIASVTEVAASVDAAKLAAQGANGQTFTLTTGIDGIVGGAGNDTINATQTATSTVLGGLDKVDGGAGVDTLNIADTAIGAGAAFAVPAGFSITNVEKLNVTTNGNIGATGASFDVSTVAGLTDFAGVAAGTVGSDVKVADTTNVSLTVAGNAAVAVAGGKAVSVVSGATGTGATSVTGKGLTSVSVKGGGAVTIDNLENTVAATTAKGTTLTAVTLDAVAGATAAVKGAALATVTLQNQKSALAVTVTNDTSTALTVNVDGVGYDATGAGVAVSVAAGSKAATLNVNATGTKSAVTLTGAAAKTVNITGSAALDLAAIATATKIDGSAATGNLTLNTLNAVTVDVKTGSGNDKFTATTTNKIAVDAGAGNDTVTLSGALVVGSTVNLGAGNDKLIGTAAALKAGVGITDSVIDGGDGTDTVSAALINAGNAALFKNFEGLSLNSTTGLDAALLTGSTLTALSMDAVSTTALYQNLSVAQVLDVSYVGDNSAFTNTLSFKDVAGTADTFAIKFTADNSSAASAPTAANVLAGTIVAAGVENFTIESAGTKAWNSLTLGADTAAKTVAVTGASNLDLAFAGTFGSTTAPNTGVSLIDGSAATGKLAINTTNVVAATAGLTVKGGSAADTITLAQKATVDAGAGNDTIIAAAAGGTFTGGAGADTFNVAAAVVGTATPAGAVITSITDAAATDKILFANLGTEVFTTTKLDVSTATALIGGTVNALDLAAAAADSTTNGQITWFQYGGNTYVVQELGANAATIGTDDIVVKLTGLIDLATASYDAVTNALTLA